MKKLGLFGRGISYSFSKKYFSEKFKKEGILDFSYEIYDVQHIEEIIEIVKKENLIGFNVTIPYKEQIISCLDELSPEAEKIQAVNTILVKEGRWIGYNTDVYGFEKTLLNHRKQGQNSAIILGNGGAAKAVAYVLERNEIPYFIVSRREGMNFENLTEKIVNQHKIIVQCTPVGTFPKGEDCVLFPFQGVGNEHLIIDLVYNPSITKFMKNAMNNNAKAVNGYEMLVEQAEKSWIIWNF